ncbi:MAG: response regulator [bacterium]
MTDVFVVDDEEDVISMLRRNLKMDGYNVKGAQNREEALEKMKQNNFPIVLLDIKFPETSGTELLREFKKIHPPTNVLMITGYASLENVMTCLGEGAIDYLTKPLDMEVVKDRLTIIESKVERWRDEIGIQ